MLHNVGVETLAEHEALSLSLCYPHTPYYPQSCVLPHPLQPSPIIGLCVDFPPVGIMREYEVVEDRQEGRVVTNTPYY